MKDNRIFDFIKILPNYYLSYIIEPNRVVYFVSMSENELICNNQRLLAKIFNNRNDALLYQDKIKHFYGLEFQILGD